MRARENGFTLTEALVCLALLSMMALLMLGGVTSATVLTQDSRRNDEALDQVMAAQTVLRDRLLMLRPTARLTSGTAEMDMDGTDSALDFFSAPPGGSPNSGILKYRLLLTPGGDLMLYHADELSDRVDLAQRTVVGWRPVVLLRGVTSLTLGYFGAAPPDGTRKWRSTWRFASTAPELVRIRVGFAGSDQREWPDLIVRPAPTIELKCNPETGSNRCPGIASQRGVSL